MLGHISTEFRGVLSELKRKMNYILLTSLKPSFSIQKKDKKQHYAKIYEADKQDHNLTTM